MTKPTPAYADGESLWERVVDLGLEGVVDRVSWPLARRAVMSIVVRFQPKNLTAEQYDAVKRREEATETYPPDGREYHVCFGTDGDLQVSEIWDSVEHLQAYRPILMPMLADAGIELSAEPEIFEVHNTVRR